MSKAKKTANEMLPPDPDGKYFEDMAGGPGSADQSADEDESKNEAYEAFLKKVAADSCQILSQFHPQCFIAAHFIAAYTLHELNLEGYKPPAHFREEIEKYKNEAAENTLHRMQCVPLPANNDELEKMFSSLKDHQFVKS